MPLRAMILGMTSAWSTRAHASLFFCSIVEEPFASVNRVDWNRPQPGAPSASPTADPVRSRMAAEKALARAFASSDARRWRGGAAHAVYGGILQIPGPSHSPEACTEGIQARARTCGGESGAPGMSLRLACMSAYGGPAPLVLALGGHTPNSETIKRPQSLHRRHPRSTLVLRRRIGCSRSVVVPGSVHERVSSTRATGRQWSPVVATGHQRPARARHSSCGRAPAALLTLC